MKTLVIMPTFNERESLPVTLAGVLDLVPDVDVLIVDDSSPDGTGALADEIAAKDARVQVMRNYLLEAKISIFLSQMEKYSS